MNENCKRIFSCGPKVEYLLRENGWEIESCSSGNCLAMHLPFSQIVLMWSSLIATGITTVCLSEDSYSNDYVFIILEHHW